MMKRLKTWCELIAWFWKPIVFLIAVLCVFGTVVYLSFAYDPGNREIGASKYAEIEEMCKNCPHIVSLVHSKLDDDNMISQHESLEIVDAYNAAFGSHIKQRLKNLEYNGYNGNK